MSYYITKTTVKAPIAHITDGADTVPLKSWEVEIAPTLTGKSAIECTQTGKNVLPNIKTRGSDTRVNLGQDDDGFSVFLHKGTYTLSATSSVNMRGYYRGENDKENTLLWSIYTTDGHGTFTLADDTNVRIWLYNGDGLSVTDVLTFMLEVGSTATTYEPYTAPTVSTVNLGRTIYGGTADVVNGTGVDENGNDFTFTPITPTPETALGVNNFWADEGDSEVTYYFKVESTEKYTIEDSTLRDIADAIRTKTEKTDPIFVEDMSEEILSITSGGGGGDFQCDRLFYAKGYDNWQVEIPTIASLITGEKYSEYVSYDTTTKKFTALKDFTAVIVAWVYTYQTYEASRSDGAFYVNSTKLAQYEANGNAAGSVGGVRLIYNLKQGDTFYPYTPTTDGYPRQYCKVYAISDIDDDVFTYTDEEAT